MRRSFGTRSARRSHLDGAPSARRTAPHTPHRHRCARRRRASDGQEKSRPRLRTASRCRLRGGVPRAGRGQCSSSSSSSA
jgi:hypothetical protein